MDPERLYILNLIQIQRTGNTLTAEAKVVLDELFDEIVADIARYNPTGVSQRYRDGRLAKLLASVKARNRAAYDAIQRQMRQDLGAFGAQQAVFAKDSLLATLAVGGAGDIVVRSQGMTASYFRKIIDADPFQGETLREWLNLASRQVEIRVGRQVKLGMAQNESMDAIIRRIRGRSVGGGQFVGGVKGVAINDAETVARTAVNEIASTAHLEVYKQNQDITIGYRYVATLDAKTTIICANLDGKVFKWDDDVLIKPPQHPNCRSRIVEIVDWESVGVEPPAGATRQERVYTRNEKGEVVLARDEQGRLLRSRVSSATNYEQWLKNQPAYVQAEVLGKGRAKLFRDGKVNLRDLIRSDGTTIPISELRNGS